jgi:hypothetical protein
MDRGRRSIPVVDNADTPSPPKVDREAVRRRAHELSQENPDAAPEENWRRAESELMAAIQMAVFGHP